MLTRSDKILIFGLVAFACFLFMGFFFVSSEVSEALIKVVNSGRARVCLGMDKRIKRINYCHVNLLIASIAFAEINFGNLIQDNCYIEN
jgi:hypothetical protein